MAPYLRAPSSSDTSDRFARLCTRFGTWSGQHMQTTTGSTHMSTHSYQYHYVSTVMVYQVNPSSKSASPTTKGCLSQRCAGNAAVVYTDSGRSGHILAAV